MRARILPNTLTLYGLDYSVYTRIARLALAEKGIEYELVETDVFAADGPPANYLTLHPFGRIPTLRHGDFVLYETGAITRYIDDAFDGPALQPTQPQQRARMNQIIGVLDAYGYRPMVWGVFVQRVSRPAAGQATDETQVAEALPQARTCLDALGNLLGEQPYLAGKNLSLADLHAAPMILYFAQTPEGERMLAEYANLSRWWRMIRARDGLTNTRSQFG